MTGFGEGEVGEAAMSVASFCARFGIGRSTFYAQVAQGRLPVRKLGRRTLVLREDADRWLRDLPTFEARKASR